MDILTRKQLETYRDYLRLSRNKYGVSTSTEEQEVENAEDAASTGLACTGPAYIDDDRSASRYAKKVRDDFQRLLSDLRSGDFGADVLAMWELSRGSRQVGEWLTLIDLCEEFGVVIRVTTHRRFYDPRIGRDRRDLIVGAADSELDSSETSDRINRNVKNSAKKGLPHGHTPYGYRRRYDERTKKLAEQYPHKKEAKVVRKAFKLAKQGRSLRSIETQFREAGIKNWSGRPFAAQHLRSLLLNPAYAGLRAHAKGRKGHRGMPLDQVNLTDAVWKGIVSKDTWWTVQNKLRDPARVKNQDGRAHHLLTFNAVCEEGHPVSAVIYTEPNRRQYRCRKGCVRVNEDELDALVVEHLKEYLSRPDVFDLLERQESDDSTEIATLRGDIAELNTRLSALAESHANGNVTLEFAARSEASMLKQVQEAERRKRELSTPSVLRGLLNQRDSIDEQWEGMELSARRQLVRILFAPHLMGAITIHRRPVGRRGRASFPLPDRVTFERVDPTTTTPDDSAAA